MDNGLFGIYQSRDIYFTLDMLRILSPKQATPKSSKSDDTKNSEKVEESKVS
jgi:hypothetical protein